MSIISTERLKVTLAEVGEVHKLNTLVKVQALDKKNYFITSRSTKKYLKNNN